MRFILFLSLLMLPGILFSQSRVKGVIKDGKGKPVAGASIAIVNSYDGAVADSLGNFSFTTTEKGSQKLSVSAMGYKPAEQLISLSGTTVEIKIALKEQIDELKAVIVSAGSFAAGDAKRATIMSSLDMATTGGANADITAALKTLPGTQQVNDQEGLFVRGGTGYETKQFIDGTLVNNPYFSSVPDIAQRGRFSPFLFKGMVFSTGGYSALYGQALSAALVMESIDLPERSEVNASLAPIFAGFGTQQLAANKKSSWGINYTYTNLNAYFKLVKQTPDYYKMPVFHNGDANFRIKTKRGGMIKYYTTFSQGQLGLRRQDIDSAVLKDAFGLTNYNWYNNLSWRENLGNGWKMQAGTGFSVNKDDIQQQVQDADNKDQQFTATYWWLRDKNFTVHNKQLAAQARLVMEKRLAGINNIRFGGEYWYSDNKINYNDSAYTITDHYKALFAESNIYMTNDLALTVGGRLEHNSVIDKVAIAPRASLAYKTSKDAQVSFAYGIFYQKPENTQLRANMDYTRATHYILNYTKMNRLQTFRIEGYYKKYDHLMKTAPVYNNDGSGYAQGMEVLWRDRKTIRNFDYWVSYSYLDTKRDYLNFPEKMQPNFAASHTASLVAKRFVTSIKTGFNVTYSFASGRPYYNLVQQADQKYSIADQGTTTTFNNVGFSLNYVPHAGKPNAKTHMVLLASVTNVLGNKQISGYHYSYNGVVKQPILPPATRFFLVGIFLSWGVDRTDDIINNNL